MRKNSPPNYLKQLLLVIVFYLGAQTYGTAQVCAYGILSFPNGLTVSFDLGPSPNTVGMLTGAQWYYIGNNGSTVQMGTGLPAAYTFPTQGTYQVCADYTSTEPGCSSTICENVIVTNNCPIDFTNTVVSDSISVLQVVNITTFPIYQNIQWTITEATTGIVDTSTGDPLTYLFPNPGSYNICVSADVINPGVPGTVVCTADTCQTYVVQNNSVCLIDFNSTSVNDSLVVFEVIPNSTVTYGVVEWVITNTQTGVSSQGQNTTPYTHLFSESGTYEVCVVGEVVDPNGLLICVADMCHTITINIPQSNCQYQLDYSTNQGMTVALGLTPLNNSPTPNIVEWYYTDPAGNTTQMGTGSPIAYTFSSIGSYNVCAGYEVSGTSCFGTVCETIFVFDVNGNCTPFFTTNMNGNLGTFEVQPIANVTDLNWENEFWEVVDPTVGGSIATGSGNPFNFDFTGLTGDYAVCVSADLLGIAGNVLCSGWVCDTVTVTPSGIPCEIDYSYFMLNDSTGVFEVDTITSVGIAFGDIEWTFTELTTGSVEDAVGGYTTYTFPNSGDYEVCVYGDVYDPNGNVVCRTDSCQTISIGIINWNCDYDVILTSNGNDVTMELFALNGSPMPPLVNWTEQGSTTSIGTGNPFTYTVPGPGTYTFCTPWAGVSCFGMECETITIGNPICDDPVFTSVIDNNNLGTFNLIPHPANILDWDSVQWTVSLNGLQIGTGTGLAFDFLFPNAGTYEICVEASLYDIGGNYVCTGNYCEAVTVGTPNVCTVGYSYSVNTGNVTFIASTSNANLVTGNETWVITGNGITTTLLGNPADYLFPDPGVYQVCLIADLYSVTTGNYECTADICKTISVGWPPNGNCEADFIWAEIAGTGTATYQAEFENTSVGNNLQYFWNFDDGTTSTDSSSVFIHDFPLVGVYNVCLTVWDPATNCQDNYCELVFITNNAPVCYFDIQLTSSGLVVTGEFLPTNGVLPNSIEWYNAADGNVLGNGQVFTYQFANYGVYEICADYAIPGTSCLGTVCETITLNNPACNMADCVFPGDTDYDGISNNYDLLPIGLQYGLTGAQRASATLDWFGQPATDWTTFSNNNINNKHVDCNGNGAIDSLDVNAIIQNYNRTHNGIVSTNFGNPNSPPIFLDFELDTILIDPAGLATLFIKADIVVGTSINPAVDLYGFAFTVHYPSALVEMNTAEMSYDNMSWFGDDQSTLDLAVDIHSVGVLDLGFTRTNMMTASGFGKVGEVSFVVTDNIIGKTTKEIPFTVTISDLIAINNAQEILPYDALSTSTIIQLGTSTSINDLPDTKFKVYPNPATDLLIVEMTDIQATSVELRTILGQLVYQEILKTDTIEIGLDALPEGIYLITVNTEKGSHTEKIVIQY